MFLFSTDIDGTIYDGPETAAAFSRFWASLPGRLSESPVLAYNTGRSLDDTRELVRVTGLPEPDWYICDVGTTIFDPQANARLDAWREHLTGSWDHDVVHGIVGDTTVAKPQPNECQSEFKSSWFWVGASPDDIDQLGHRITAAGIDGQVVYSSSRDLDLLPARANKGNAVAFLAAMLSLPHGDVIVAGDSGNDAAMYRVSEVRGVIVANAEARLRNFEFATEVFRSQQACAFGVIEGIEHFLGLSAGPVTPISEASTPTDPSA